MQKLTLRLARLTQSRPAVYPIAPASHTWAWLVMTTVVAALVVAGVWLHPF